MLTMVIPLYISEVCGFSTLGLTHALTSVQVSLPDIRGGLVVLQQRKSTPPNLCFASSDRHKSLSVEDKLTLSGSFDHYWYPREFLDRLRHPLHWRSPLRTRNPLHRRNI